MSDDASEGGPRVIIDAHHHLWRAGTTQHDWSAPDTATLDRDFLSSDLAPLLETVGVDATVLVQTANSLDDTMALLGLADRLPFVAGVVGWVPLDDPSRTREALALLGAPPLLRGVRHLTNLESDPDWLTRPRVLAGLGIVADHGLSLDTVPMSVPQVEQVTKVARVVPHLRIVVDHLGRPPLLENRWEPWASTMAELAAYPNVAVKLSVGLDIVRRWSGWDVSRLQPYIDHVLEFFGPDRVMAASNWPVVLLAQDYVSVWSDIRTAIATLSATGRQAVIGNTAREWYVLARPT